MRLLSLMVLVAVACVPPGGGELDKVYQAELLACVNRANSVQEKCQCRLDTDLRWGLCDSPPWPQIGRCDYRCVDK